MTCSEAYVIHVWQQNKNVISRFLVNDFWQLLMDYEKRRPEVVIIAYAIIQLLEKWLPENGITEIPPEILSAVRCLDGNPVELDELQD